MGVLRRVVGAVVAVGTVVLLSSVPARGAPWVPKLPGTSTSASTDPEHYTSHSATGATRR